MVKAFRPPFPGFGTTVPKSSLISKKLKSVKTPVKKKAKK
jgi:hypothetical protein